jgi:uncharacterized protein (DUF2147 family)
MRTSVILLLLILVASALPCFAASGDDIVGVWFNEPKDAKIDISKCGDTYCGKIVWLKTPDYPAASKDGTPGTPKLDHNNPDAALKKMPVMGLVIVRDFHFAGDNLWNDGKVYDPKNGKTYSAKMTLISPTQLNVRGFVGVSLFGRTEKWTKAQ